MFFAGGVGGLIAGVSMGSLLHYRVGIVEAAGSRLQGLPCDRDANRF